MGDAGMSCEEATLIAVWATNLRLNFTLLALVVLLSMLFAVIGLLLISNLLPYPKLPLSTVTGFGSIERSMNCSVNTKAALLADNILFRLVLL